MRETVTKILKDPMEDSEVRINAYLVLVENPSAQVSEFLKQLLATEKSNQGIIFTLSKILPELREYLTYQLH